MHPKFLIIRFSSFGDILMCMSVVNGIKNKFPDAEIHWIARKDMASFLEMDPQIDKIWQFDRKKGLWGLFRFACLLNKEKFNSVYDAHNNLRSRVVKMTITPGWKRWLGMAPKLTVRKKYRFKRFLLFTFRINCFPKPFRGMVSFQKPLQKWDITHFTSKKDWNFSQKTRALAKKLLEPPITEKSITIAPSAAWELKRWPVAYWKKLIELLPNYYFIILGGSHDKFCKEIAQTAPERTQNLAGKTTLLESLYIVSQSEVVVSADTGLLHAADLFGIMGIALMGPTAFGFPSGKQIKVMEVELPCRPCTKHGNTKCRREIHKQCLVEITPEKVAKKLL